MGMSASQARLLNITARLSDLELSEQLISNKKIRLAVKSDAVSQKYLDALNGKTVTTGGTEGTSDKTTTTPIAMTYDAVTGPDSTLKSQYFVVDGASGKVLVSEAMAKKYQDANALPDPSALEKFLELNGANKASGGTTTPQTVETEAYKAAKAKVQQASDDFNGTSATIRGTVTQAMVDKYNQDIKNTEKSIQDTEALLVIIRADDSIPHPCSEENEAENTKKDLEALLKSLQDNPVILGAPTDYIPNPERDIKFAAYQKAQADAEAINPKTEVKNVTIGGTPAGENVAKAGYYTNLFNRMGGGATQNFKTETNDKTIKDTNSFNSQLRDGTLTLEKFNATSGKFESSPIGSNVEFNKTEKTPGTPGTPGTTTTVPLSDTELKKVEIEYDKEMEKIQAQDKQYDMQMKQLDTEHSALQTEYDSVDKVLDKNIERTFKVFG